jgi:hypothetical protein
MPSPWIRDGWFNHRCAVALFAERIGIPDAAPIFRSALASPGGYRVSNAPCASARNSRCRETASRTI